MCSFIEFGRVVSEEMFFKVSVDCSSTGICTLYCIYLCISLNVHFFIV